MALPREPPRPRRDLSPHPSDSRCRRRASSHRTSGSAGIELESGRPPDLPVEDRAIRAEVLDWGSWSWRDIATVPPRLLGPVFAAGGGGVIISSCDMAEEEFSPAPCPELRDVHLAHVRGVPGLVDRSRQESLDAWLKEYGVRLRSPFPVGSPWFLEVVGCRGR
ncbi:hypothetical protein BT93_H3132 [Corymbia citriodora subsp. variegata]|nr:hypothetical protein BT93_H3132 [Corymbia citriodora subsp. variegata]